MANRSYQWVSTSLLLLALFFFTSSALWAQSFPPKNLGAVVNSECAEVNPVASITGDTLFFSRMNHKENHFGLDSQDIWMTTKKSDAFRTRSTLLVTMLYMECWQMGRPF